MPEGVYTLGVWRVKPGREVEAMRANPRAQEGIRDLVALCTEATPGSFRVGAESQ